MDKYLSVITNFGCHGRCPYCIVRENGIKVPKSTVDGLDKLEDAITLTGANIVSISGGGDPLYRYSDNPLVPMYLGRNYEIYDCAKWQSTIGETLMFRQSLGVKNRGLDKCFACGYKFGSEEKPYLGLIKNHSNQFICRECAMKVNPERVRYSEEN